MVCVCVCGEGGGGGGGWGEGGEGGGEKNITHLLPASFMFSAVRVKRFLLFFCYYAIMNLFTTFKTD